MKSLRRSSNKMIGGVLGGFAEYVAIDPVWIRLGFVFFALIGFFWPAVIIYIVGLLIIPKEDNLNNSEEKVKSSNSGYLILGTGLIIFGVIFFINQFFHINIWRYVNDLYYNFRYYGGAIVLIALGILIIVKGRK